MTQMDTDAIRRILPHRSPFLLVDAVDEVRGHPPRELDARFRVDPEHPVLAGHFPGRPLWPGACTIEGIAQASGLLWAISASHEAHELRGAVMSAANIKLKRPVWPAHELRYFVSLRRVVEKTARFDARAEVSGFIAAEGHVMLTQATLDEFRGRPV
jgi:3-hydroxymyristoyl/3-hydroxydecanoyl-(acyl carrier protein) dehydratase